MRFRATHEATVYGERETSTNELGTVGTTTDAPLIVFGCRYDEVRPSFETGPTGERTTAQPEVTAPVYGRDPDDESVRLSILETIDEGNTLDLVALGSGGIGQIETDVRYRIDSIDVRRGRGHAPKELLLEVTRYDG